MNVFTVLLTALGDQQPRKTFRRASALQGIKGRPDYILLAGDSLLFPIEIKTKLVLSEDDIVEKYNTQEPLWCVIYLIIQVFGYMAHNECQYGVLSTYDKT